MNGFGMGLYALCTGRRKFPGLSMSSYLSHTKLPSERQLAVRSDTGERLDWLQLSPVQAFHSQCLLTSEWLAFQPCLHPPASLYFYLFWFLAETFQELLNSQDPVSLLSRSYICAELLRNETSSNKRGWGWGTHWPVCCVGILLAHSFCKARFLLAHIRTAAGSVIVSAFFSCWGEGIAPNLDNELCQTERNRQQAFWRVIQT